MSQDQGVQQATLAKHDKEAAQPAKYTDELDSLPGVERRAGVPELAGFQRFYGLAQSPPTQGQRSARPREQEVDDIEQTDRAIFQKVESDCRADRVRLQLDGARRFPARSL